MHQNIKYCCLNYILYKCMYINECKATAFFSMAYLEKNINCWKTCTVS
jgi:hypothetical protein